MQLIPALLAKTQDEWNALLDIALQQKDHQHVQVDFVDEFFSNQTIPLAVADVNRYVDFDFDAHLMVDPEVVWDEISLAKISGYKRIIVQTESISDQRRFLNETEGYQRGLGIDLDSSLEQIEDFVWPELQVVLLMAVEAGFGGQLFDNRVLEKVKRLVTLRAEAGYSFTICIDGGVEQLHVPILEELGVDEVVVGVRRMVDWKL